MGLSAYTGDTLIAGCGPGYTLASPFAPKAALCGFGSLGNLYFNISTSTFSPCSPLPCFNPVIPPENGYTFPAVSVAYVDETIQVYCNTAQGYILSGGANQITCYPNRLFSEPPFGACVPNGCPNLDLPQDGVNVYYGYANEVNSSVVVTCNAGYQLVGGASRAICDMELLQWLPPVGNCAAIACRAPPVFANARCVGQYGACNESLYGHFATYTCNAGYQNVLSVFAGIVYRCNTTGHWEGAFIQCEPSMCPVLSRGPPGYATMSSRLLGGEARLFCPTGYNITGGPANATCSSGFSWTLGVCTPCADVPPPLIANGVVTGPPVYKTATCNSNFTLSGFADVNSCTNYSPMPTCVPLLCPPLVPPPRGRFAKHVYYGGEVATLMCEPGYSPFNGVSQPCDGNAMSFSGPALCVVISNYCPGLLPPAVNSNDAVIGGSVMQDCLGGLELVGPLYRNCTAQGWSGYAGVCMVPTVVPHCAFYAGVCTVCFPGYTLSGGSCFINTTFCAVLTAPVNSTVSQPSREVGSVATFACNAGTYYAGGATVVACAHNGSYVGTQPIVCIPCSPLCAGACNAAGCLSCADPSKQTPLCNTPKVCVEQPPMGVLTDYVQGVFGMVRQYRCPSGLALSGTPQAACTATGWEVTATGCGLVACGLAPAAPFATVSTVGSSATYTCNSGYTPEGSTLLVCQAGVWMGSVPICVPALCKSPYFGDPCTQPRNPVVAPGASIIYDCCEGKTPLVATQACSLNGSVAVLAPSVTASNCLLKPCVFPNVSLPNGFVTISGTGQFGTYLCNSGYIPFGSVQRACQNDGTLTGRNDTYCMPMLCEPLLVSLRPYARMSCNGRALGSACTFTCLPGYAPYGLALRTCDDRGGINPPEWTPGVDFGCSQVNATRSVAAVITAQIVVATNGRMTLEARDEFGVLVDSTADLIEVEFVTAALGAVRVPTSASATSGMGYNYDVAFTAITLAGAHQLAVYINLEPIPGLLNITLLPGVFNAKASAVLGSALTRGVFGFPERFTLVGRDAFSNALLSGGTAFDARLSANGRTDLLTVVNKAGTGNYTAVVLPWDAGVYTLSVTTGGISVGASPWLTTITSYCLPGQFAVSPTGPCAICPPSSYSATTNEAACTACPSGNECDAGSSSIAACTCKAGYYSLNGTGVPCPTCPIGAVCDGKQAPPRARPGYFAVDSTSFVACALPAACIGDSKCKVGYQGFACGACATGFYRDVSLRTCAKCPSGGVVVMPMVALLLTAFFSAVILAAAMLVARDPVWAKEQTAKYAGSDAATMNDLELRRHRRVPYSLSIGLFFMQVVGMVGQSPFSWPTAVRRSLNAFDVANVGLSLFPIECSTASFEARFAASTLYPLLALPAAAIIGALVLIGPLAPLRASLGLPGPGCTFAERLALFKVSLIKALFGLLPYLYIPLSRAVCAMFNCSKAADGKYRLELEPSVQCFSLRWNRLLILGLPLLLLYVLGIPASIATALYRSRRTLRSPYSLVRFSNLYQVYRSRVFFFELVLLLKRFVIVFTVVFISRYQVFLALILEAVFGGFTLVHVRVQPYYYKTYNDLEIQLNAVLCLFLLLGIFFLADKFANTATRTLVIVLAILLLVAGMIRIIVSLVDEVRSFYLTARKEADAAADSPEAEPAPASDVEMLTLAVGGSGAALSAALAMHASLDRQVLRSIAKALPDVRDPATRQRLERLLADYDGKVAEAKDESARATVDAWDMGSVDVFAIEDSFGGGSSLGGARVTLSAPMTDDANAALVFDE